MSSAAPVEAIAPARAACDAPSPRELIASQVAALTRLTAIGMEIAEAAGRAAAADAGAADPALAFSRAARAVRLTIALQSRLMADLAALDGAEAKAQASEGARRRDRIHTQVEQAIEAEHSDADEAERLSSVVWERLTDTDDADLLARPVEEVVARICQDLGLPPAQVEPVFSPWRPSPTPPRAAASSPGRLQPSSPSAPPRRWRPAPSRRPSG